MKNLFLLSIIFLFSCNPSFEKDGGTRVVLEAKDADKMQMERIMLILAQRIDLFGVIKPNIRIGDSPNRIIVELPGKFDNQRMRRVLQSSAKLEFWETFENKEMYEKIARLNTNLSEDLFPELKDTVAEQAKPNLEGASMDDQFAAQKSTKEIEAENLAKIKKQNPLFALLNPALRNDGRSYELTEGPVVGYALAKDTAQVNGYLNSPTAKKIFGRSVKFLWTMQPMDQEQKVYQLVAIKVNRSGKAALWENVVDDAKVIYDDQSGSPQISMTMTRIAGMDWQKITRDNVGKAIAIVIDDQVYSYPIVMSEIAGGLASISGNFTKEEAQDFASVLKAGCLPVPIRIVAEEEVAPVK